MLIEILGFACGIWSIVLFLRGAKISNNIFSPLLTIFFEIIGLMSEILIKTYYGAHVDTPYSIKVSSQT